MSNEFFKNKNNLKNSRETAAREAEGQRYHSGVRVLFNLTAYSNEAITLGWIKIDIYFMTLPYDRWQSERLVTLDIFSGQGSILPSIAQSSISLIC